MNADSAGVDHDDQRDLTLPERKVLELIGDGLSNREIGAKLGVAEKTVKNHITSLLSKMGLQRRTQVAAWVAGQRAAAGVTELARGTLRFCSFSFKAGTNGEGSAVMRIVLPCSQGLNCVYARGQSRLRHRETETVSLPVFPLPASLTAPAVACVTGNIDSPLGQLQPHHHCESSTRESSSSTR